MSEYYVAANGASGNAGTLASPWSLASVLNGAHTSSILPGDIVWCRGGTYTGNLTSNLNGSVSAPIHVRAYQHERATLDGTLLVQGSYTWFWGWEVMSSDPPNSSNIGVSLSGSNTKLVNSVVHDTGVTGVSIWNGGVNGEVYGCVIYNCGTHNNLDHGCYFNGNTGSKWVRNNIVFNNWAYGLHAYSATHGELQNIHIVGNTSFNNGSIGGYGHNPDLFVGGSPITYLWVEDNCTWQPNDDELTVWLGAYDTGHQHLQLNNNYVGGWHNYNQSLWTDYNASNNSEWEWSNPPASGVWVIVRPNEYEAGFAMVTIYNWDDDANVGVDLDGVLNVGDEYEIRDAQNYYGTPRASGTFAGGQVSVPMTAQTPPTPIGRSYTTPESTGTRFHAFVVVRTAEAPEGTDVSGTIAGSGALSGTVRPVRNLSGTAQGTGTLAGAVSPIRYLSGTIAGSGGLAGHPVLAGSIAGTVAGVGVLTGEVTLSGVVHGTIAGHGGLSGIVTGGTIPAMEMPSGKGRLVRVEIWSDFECAGGVRAAVLAGVGRVMETKSLTGDNQLQVSVVANSPGTEAIFHRRIVRLLFDDESVEEWRLSAIESGRDSNVTLELTAVDVLRELTDRCLVRRREADNSTTFQFEVVGLTLAQIMTGYVLPSLAEAGEAWWSLGTVESNMAIPSFLFEWTTPMEAVKRLAQDASVEFTRLRLGATGYQLIFPKRIGANAGPVRVRFGRNLLSGTRRLSSDNQATVIYGRGADLADGFTVDMSGATWRVTHVDTDADVVTLDDGVGGMGPVGFDDQLNGMQANGQLVLDSTYAAQTIKVPDASVFALGQVVRFTDATGAPVTALSDPVQKAQYGTKVAVLQRPDLPNTHNLLSNAAMRDWPVGTPAPVGWGVDGAVTATRITDSLYTRYGGQSMKMEVSYPGAGVSLLGPITPTEAAPFFSGLALIQVVSGRARVELWFSDGVTTWMRPSGGDTIACTLYTNVWESIEFAGVDALKLGAIAGAVVVRQDGPTPLVCYLDGVQLTQTATQMPYFEGNGSTALWQAVNERLALYAPPMVSLSGRIVDPQEFPYEQLTLGGPIEQRDEELYQSVMTRIIGYSRELTNRVALNLNLSSDPADVIDVMARPRRPDPIQRPTVTFATPTITAYFGDVNNSPGVIQVTLETIPADATAYYLIVARTDPVPPMGDAAWHTYTAPFAIQPGETPLKLLAYATIGGTNSSVSAYPIDANAIANLVATDSESPAGTFNLDWAPDDDTNCVDIYRVVNGAGAGYPTVDGSLTGAILGTAWRGWKNPSYNGGGMNAGDVNWMGGTHFSESGFSPNDVVGWALVATSRKGATADPVFGKRTMAGTVTPALSSFVLNALTVVGGTVRMPVAWTRTSAVTSSYSLLVYESINNSVWRLVQTIADVTALNDLTWDTGMEYSTNPADPMTMFRAKGVLKLGATVVATYFSDIQRIRTTGLF